MALKDCLGKLKKAGHKVSPVMRAQLEKYIAAGLTDTQAVQRMIVENASDIISIVDRVQAAGVEVKTGRGAMAEIRDFRTEKLRALMGDRSEANEKVKALNDEHTLLKQDADLFDELLSKGVNAEVSFNELTENELKMMIGQLMMRATTTELGKNRDRIWPEDRFRVAMERKTLEVSGLTPDEIYNSRVALQTKMAENRKQKQLMDADRQAAQDKIDAGFKPETTRDPDQLFQSPIDEMSSEEFEDIDANVSADNARIARIMGPNMYGDMADMGKVTVKELMQNAFDAARTAVMRGDVEEGIVDIALSDDGYTITVTDNGIGMTPDHIINGLLTIGGTMKEGDINSGGFGFAKMLFLFGGERIQVETVRDGVKSTMDVTGAEVIKNAEDQSVPLTIKREKTDEASGSKVTVTIPKDYQKLDTGEIAEVKALQSWDVTSVTDRQILHPNVKLTRGSSYLSDDSGSKFPANEFAVVGTVQFEWGTADVLVSKAEKSMYPRNTLISVNGLRQFDIATKENPLEMFGPAIKREIIIDLHPTVEPDDAKYPFHHNRQGLRPHATGDIATLQLLLAQRNAREKAGQLAVGYGSVRTITDGKFGEPIDLTPEIDIAEFESETLQIGENDVVEIIDGKLTVNGEVQPAVTKEKFAETTFDVDKLKIPQERVPRDTTIVHNNQQFLETGLDEEWSEHAGKDLIEVLIEKFGEDAVAEYYDSIGQAFIRLRNLVAIKGDQKLYEGLGRVGAGVSVLGLNFYGVHTKLPGEMMFINPGADPVEEGAREETMTDAERARLQATSMMTTMIHEIAHFTKSGHGNDYLFALQNTFATTFAETDFVNGVLKDLQHMMGEHYGIYSFISGALKGKAIENTGVSLKDLGQEQTRDEDDAADPTGERGGQGRGGVGATDTASAGPAGTDAIDTGVPEAGTDGGTVAAPGSVHPQAGEDSEFLTRFHGSPFTFDEFDMDQIGSGEGAQAFGWGLYLAEEQDVGKMYVPRDFDAEEQMLAAYKQAEQNEDYIAMEMWEDAMMHWTPDEIRNHFNVETYDQEVAAKARSVANVLEHMASATEGHLYEVEISAEADAKMLDQDVGLEGQPEFVQELVNEKMDLERAEALIAEVEQLADDSLSESVTDGTPTPKTDAWQAAYGSEEYAFAKFVADPNFDGADFYNHLKYSIVARGGITQAVQSQGAAEQASLRLKDMGVPGMKFLDGYSREDGGGSRNTILFSTDPIASVTRDGQQVFDGAAEPIEGVTPQQRQTNLDEFMYDSVVVNEDGTPKVVYHGTQSTEAFEEFIPQNSYGAWNNLGTWFSSESVHAEKLAKGYEPDTAGQMFPVYLSIRNPFEGTWEELQAHIDRAIEMHNANTGDTMDKRDQPMNATGPSPVGTMLKEYFQDHGYDGIVLKDWLGDFEPAQDVFVAFESNQIKSAIGNEGTFDIEDPNILKQDERGRISFNEARKGFIEILSSGDSSTFIHETGHMYLEVMKWAAQQESAPQSLRDDWERIKQHTGATDEHISKEAHEKFANAFEIYTLEGKAPSLALQDSFNAFRRWLLTIYSKIRNIQDVHLNDEIRGVFDRMLASDEEIAIAEQSQGFVALFADAETAGVSQEVFDHYATQLQRAHDDAVEKETRRMLAAMTRDEKAWWEEEKAKLREEITAEAHEMRVYRALALLQKGKLPNGEPLDVGSPFKIDKKSLLALLGEDQQSLNDLPRPYIYTLKGGVDVDIAAKKLGYRDGLEMIRELGNATPMKAFIEAMTEVRMREIYPDPLTDGTIADNALKAVHSTGRLGILGTELRMLRSLIADDRAVVRANEQGDKRQDREAKDANKGQLPKRAEMAMLKAGARAKIDSLQIRNIKPHVYLRAEQKAGREAFEAMERRDYQKAYAAKLRQIINHEMYRAALAVQKEMDSTRNFIARFEGTRKQRQLGKAGVLNQVLAVLEGIELRKKSLAQVDRDSALKELKQAVLDGRMVVTPETFNKIMDESVNWQEFTPEELRGMKDVLKQIEHGAVNEDKMTVNGELIDYQEAENELAMSITENGEEVPLRPGGVKTSGERANNNIDQGIMTWLRPSSIARVLDKSGFGALTRLVIAPMRRAYAEKLIPMLHQAQRDVADIYRKHYNASELGKMSTRLYDVPALGETYSRSELLSMALNWGNQGNRDAVLGGTYEGSTVFSEQAVKQMLAHLTAKDWAFVQDIWDYNDTYREQAFDAEERRRGIRPEKVEPLPFEIRTADGQTILVRGGYHPLRYDRAFDPESGKKPSAERAAENIEAQMQHLAVGGFVTANTRAGSTYARVKNHGRVVRLGLNIIDSHLREVIRDIAIGDEVIYIKRLLESGGVKRAMLDTNNAAALEALDLWLTDSAVGELPSENIWEFSAAWIRTGFTKAKLGWNFTVMFLQFTGLFQTIAVIGAASFGRGLGKFMQNPAAAMRHVTEVSHFIKTRYEVGAFDKDVQDTKALVESEFGNMPTRWKNAYNLIGSTLFTGIAAAQKVVDVVTWMGAYEKGLNDESLMLSENDAIIYADTQVEAAQTSGFFSDRSGLERGTTGLKKNRQSQFIRIWTTLISYMLAKSNIAYEKHKDTDYKDPKQVSQLFFDLIMLYTVEGMASAWLYGRLPEEDDEPEDWAMWAAAATGESAISGVPFVREIAAARFGGGNTPIGVFSNDALRMIDQLAQGENDWALWDSIADVTGTAAHLPTGQISKTGKTLWEEGLDAELYEYFTGPRD